MPTGCARPAGRMRKGRRSTGRRGKRTSAKLVESVKRRASGYDCVVPVSGGKDSTWQILKCLEHGLQAARGHLEDAGADGHRPAQSRQSGFARCRSHRLAGQPQGRSAVHAEGLRTLRQHGHSDASCDLHHSAAGSRSISAFRSWCGAKTPRSSTATPRPRRRVIGSTGPGSRPMASPMAQRGRLGRCGFERQGPRGLFRS